MRIGLACHSRLFRDTYFIGPLELEINKVLPVLMKANKVLPPKVLPVQTLNNPINIFLINPNIILYHAMFFQ